MESKVVGFCAVVMILGIIAALTGFSAEANRVKTYEIRFSYDGRKCFVPSRPASALGIISALFAIFTQVCINITIGGCRCCRNDPNSTPISKLLSAFSWVATVVAVILLFDAAESNNTCNGVKPGIFATGAILAFLSALFGIAAYITSTPPPQIITNPAVGIPVGANVDPEKIPMPYPPQQYPPQQYTPQQFPPQQYTQ